KLLCGGRLGPREHRGQQQDRSESKDRLQHGGVDEKWVEYTKDSTFSKTVWFPGALFGLGGAAFS
ncbi:MAG: hypothetical protein V5A48_07750, partial [Salinivenus sp.]